MTWSSFKEFLVAPPRRGRRGSDPLILFLIPILYFTSLVMFIFCADQFRRLRTYVTRHCRVLSGDVEGPLDKGVWGAIWKVTMIDEEDQRLTETEQTIKSRVQYSSKSRALKLARKKQIGEIYECYRHRDYPLQGWPWMWSKPSKLKAIIFLLSFLVSFTTASTFYILRKYYQSIGKEEQRILQFNQTNFN